MPDTWTLDVPDPSDLMEGDPPAPGDRWCSLRPPGWPRRQCHPSIEGTADEWLAIADAIETWSPLAFKRVAFSPADLRRGGALRSPRNSTGQRDRAQLTAAELTALVANIRDQLA